MELNPNHKVTSQARAHWHVLAAAIMVKLGVTEVQITPDVLDRMQRDVNIVVDARGESQTGFITLRLVDEKTALALAKKEGGMPYQS